MQLLLVEDSDSLVKVISHIMDGLFESIIHAGTMEGALAHIATETPDVIWLDLVLPDSTDADATMSRIPRFRLSCPDATIVVMSGMDGPAVKNRCIALGADAFLSKAAPIRAAQIIGLLASGCLNRIQGGGVDGTAELLEKVTAALMKLISKPHPTPT